MAGRRTVLERRLVPWKTNHAKKRKGVTDEEPCEEEERCHGKGSLPWKKNRATSGSNYGVPALSRFRVRVSQSTTPDVKRLLTLTAGCIYVGIVSAKRN